MCNVQAFLDRDATSKCDLKWIMRHENVDYGEIRDDIVLGKWAIITELGTVGRSTQSQHRAPVPSVGLWRPIWPPEPARHPGSAPAAPRLESQGTSAAAQGRGQFAAENVAIDTVCVP
eukprot:SAG31_NODE_110_length_24476_cov_9.909654_11_plen_118_part_00